MTSREKYEAIKALLARNDLSWAEANDKLVRILLDLPETDPPALRVGDMVRTEKEGAIGKVGSLVGYTACVVTLEDGSQLVLPASTLTPIASWNPRP